MTLHLYVTTNHGNEEVARLKAMLRSAAPGEPIEFHEVDARYHRNSEARQHEAMGQYVRHVGGSVDVDMKDDSRDNRIDLAVVDVAYTYAGAPDRIRSALPYLQVNRAEFPLLFPAVAALGRIVLLPTRARHLLAASSGFLVRPISQLGAAFVAFSDRDSLAAAEHLLSTEIQRQVRITSKRSMDINGLVTPDVDYVARSLDLDVQLVEQLLQREVAPDIGVVVADGPQLRAGHRGVVAVEVVNRSSHVVESVLVAVRAPLTAMREPCYQRFERLDAGGSGRVRFELCPATAPFCPIEVTIEVPDDDVGSRNIVVPVLLAVDPG